jgi:hypothetical protein
MDGSDKILLQYVKRLFRMLRRTDQGQGDLMSTDLFHFFIDDLLESFVTQPLDTKILHMSSSISAGSSFFH